MGILPVPGVPLQRGRCDSISCRGSLGVLGAASYITRTPFVILQSSFLKKREMFHVNILCAFSELMSIRDLDKLLDADWEVCVLGILCMK